MVQIPIPRVHRIPLERPGRTGEFRAGVIHETWRTGEQLIDCRPTEIGPVLPEDLKTKRVGLKAGKSMRMRDSRLKIAKDRDGVDGNGCVDFIDIGTDVTRRG